MSTDTSAPLQRSSGRERITIGVITAAFAILLSVWACVTPMFQAPDEPTHFNSALRLAEGGGWPAPGHAYMYNATNKMQTSAAGTPPAARPTIATLFTEHPGVSSTVDQMTQHPPTYYAADAAVLKLFHFQDLRWDLAVMVLRLFDVLLVTPLPLLVWASVRRLTRSPRAALVAAMALFAVPQLDQIGSSVTSDAPILLLGGVISWLGIRMLSGDLRWRTMIGLSAALGVAAATKGTALPIIGFVVVTILVAGFRVIPLPVRILRVVIAGVITLALSGWWWIHNVLAYHALQPNGLAGVRPAVPWAPGATPNYGVFFNQMWTGLSGTFWGTFGKAQFPMTPILTDILTVLTVMGIVVFGFRRGSRGVSFALLVFPLALLLSLMADAWHTYDQTQGIFGVQGRYLFPGIVAGIALLAVAWRRATPTPASRVRFGRIVSVGAPLVGVYGLTVAYRGFFEKTDLAVDRTGLAHLAYTTPLGRDTFAVLLALLVVLGLISVVAVWRAAGDARLASVDGVVAPDPSVTGAPSTDTSISGAPSTGPLAGDPVAGNTVASGPALTTESPAPAAVRPAVLSPATAESVQPREPEPLGAETPDTTSPTRGV